MNPRIKNVDNLSFEGKKALIRVDFNVPLDDNNNVTDDTRIQAAVPTINKILKDGGAVILMSHLGRPKSGPEDKFSLRHIVVALEKALGTSVKFAPDCIGDEAKNIAEGLKGGEVLLLENLRFYKEEEKGDEEFAKKLAHLGDIYVNDAFGTAHRAHASTAVIAQYFDIRVCGYLMLSELKNADMVLGNPERPYTAIMGGAKISDKILIIERLLDKVDNLIIGGGMSYTFAKAQGGTIGNSLLEADKMDFVLELMEKAKTKGVNLILPVDTVISKAFANDAEQGMATSGEIPDGWMGLDIGPKTRELFAETVLKSKTILWNGPMGVFEMDSFDKGTKAIAEAVAQATKDGAYSLIGGGDSAAAVNKFGYGEAVSFVSTGGGALLEHMEGKVLPGVAALEP
ncbi:MAG TPA: phosphoglycerate kinase [Algoriphagus sp.]|jgi:phosphoglycerate kinase|uniref:phosphoglycerate kinase n=3 Tax=Algoriphagus TaxID=246875 RepID=UPI000C5C1AB9|nr:MULTISPECIES: phosphoglycerate kinase [unclassified Algoriphagus]MAL14263.1 phosphoglycerate kinase [Algoriphagus sp.]QYH37411.1 phosphoglycerate kinase [Algoriphagus sp. NBT04N3]HAD53391.1 phosphoglycerate kinase [Algoriphagus sp.]HAH35780.1 phosphoglycerate kinase [Algoriphagus sp.]HCD88965.1 phosphoglycerate kinase [Algoriphagus sp.]|tara:strand:- start:25579 stop:26778 length:1200 start_codon:yes stop_codon:yes gene_type:complete